MAKNNNQNMDLPEFGRVTASTDVTYSNAPVGATEVEEMGMLDSLKMAFTPGGNEMSGMYGDHSVTESIALPIFQFSFAAFLAFVCLGLFALAFTSAFGNGVAGLKDSFLWSMATKGAIISVVVLLITAFMGGLF